MFSRYGFIDITKEDIKNVHSLSQTFLLDYIAVTAGQSLKPSVFTSNFKELNMLCQKKRLVCLRGPKGCGKSFTLAATFLVCCKKNEACLFITPKSLKVSEYCSNYLKEIVKEHLETHPEINESILRALDNGHMIKAWELLTLRLSVVKEMEVLVFADLSNMMIEKNKSIYHEALISILQSCLVRYRVILSIPSGAQHILAGDAIENTSLCRDFEKLLENFSFMSIKAFTETEASEFLEEKGSSLKFNDVKPVCGTNPLLLSRIPNDPLLTVASNKNNIVEFVKVNVVSNFTGLVKNTEYLQQYFMQDEMLSCRKFAYYATKEDVLTKKEIDDYHGTLLHAHNLTVLEGRKLEKVLEDGEDNEVASKVQEGDREVQQILRWNFPIMGEIYTKILTDFLKTSAKDTFAETCQKLASFAGFWYEALFFEHHEHNSKITVRYCTLSDKESVLELTISSVVSLSLLDTEVKQGILYEMRASYPVVDAVGYLKGNDENRWLVFIQVSLQEYVKHRSLCDLFHRAPMHSGVLLGRANKCYETV